MRQMLLVRHAIDDRALELESTSELDF